MKVMTF